MFKLDLATKQETVVYTFSGKADGSNPWGGLVRDPKGNLYGTAPFGGNNSAGVIFKVDPSGNETVLHAFDYSHGSNPTADLLLDPSGNLYGTTATGGNLNRCAGLGCGVIFRRGCWGEYKLLHIFTGPGKGDGASPTHGLTRDAAGNIYGTTENGGLPDCDYYELFEPVATLVAGCGTIFKLDATTGDEMLLYEFNAAPDASNPRAPLIRTRQVTFMEPLFTGVSTVPGAFSDLILAARKQCCTASWDRRMEQILGVVWCATLRAISTAPPITPGVRCYCGTVFMLDPAGNHTVPHAFAGTDGQYPGEPLILYRGALYGMTSGGGTLSDGSLGTGVIFKITPDPIP